MPNAEDVAHYNQIEENLKPQFNTSQDTKYDMIILSNKR